MSKVIKTSSKIEIGDEMSEDIKQEIKLKNAVLDSVIMLLSAMEFSQKELTVEEDVLIAIDSLKDAAAVYSEWSGGSYSD
jgi:hypothetical protein